MDDLKSFLIQSSYFIDKAPLPYQTNFSFLSKYPYDLIKVTVPEWVRVDGIGRNLVNNQYGWKLLCIFNDLLSPIDILSRDYIYIPADFSTAISWIRNLNKKNR